MIKFKRFDQFITEAAESGKLKLVVISENKSKGADTPEFLVNRAKKKGMGDGATKNYRFEICQSI